jgi:acetolactate synthase-1/2/3 large subunit
MRMLGMHGSAFANYAVEDCDFLITLGARFDDRVAGSPPKFAPRARSIAQFDIDPAEINKVKPVAGHHVGDLKDSLRTLVAAARKVQDKPDLSAWHAELAALKRDHPMDYERKGALVQPYYIIEEITDPVPRTGVSSASETIRPCSSAWSEG